jgi:hypothetical protein
VAAGSVAGRDRGVRPALAVDAVDSNHPDPAAVDQVGDRIDHPEALEIGEDAFQGREGNDRAAVVAV